MGILKAIFEALFALFSKRAKVHPELADEPVGEVGSAETEAQAKKDEEERKSTEKVEKIVQKEVKPMVRPKVKDQDKERLESELGQLQSKNPELHTMLMDLVQFVHDEFQKDVVLTMILRTQAEQDEIYGGTVNSAGRSYDEKPWRSPHQFWHAMDLRSWIYTEEELQKMVDWINRWGKEHGNYYKWTAKVHDVGKGMHFHVQFVKP